MEIGLTKKRILELFDLLNFKLKAKDTIGELYLVGGAVMCLVFEVRESTKDVDTKFAPTSEIRRLVEIISREEGLARNWLNDAVKGYFGEKPAFKSFLELSHLRVFVAEASYLLAMKCLAMRLGPEFHDEDDIRYLLRYLNIASYEEALTRISQFYPTEKFPQKTLYALEEILS